MYEGKCKLNDMAFMSRHLTEFKNPVLKRDWLASLNDDNFTADVYNNNSTRLNNNNNNNNNNMNGLTREDLSDLARWLLVFRIKHYLYI